MKRVGYRVWRGSAGQLLVRCGTALLRAGAALSMPPPSQRPQLSRLRDRFPDAPDHWLQMVALNAPALAEPQPLAAPQPSPDRVVKDVSAWPAQAATPAVGPPAFATPAQPVPARDTQPAIVRAVRNPVLPRFSGRPEKIAAIGSPVAEPNAAGRKAALPIFTDSKNLAAVAPARLSASADPTAAVTGSSANQFFAERPVPAKSASLGFGQQLAASYCEERTETPSILQTCAASLRSAPVFWRWSDGEAVQENPPNAPPAKGIEPDVDQHMVTGDHVRIPATRPGAPSAAWPVPAAGKVEPLRHFGEYTPHPWPTLPQEIPAASAWIAQRALAEEARLGRLQQAQEAV